MQDDLLARGAKGGKPLDPASVTVAHAVLSASIKYAQAQGLLLRNVCSLVPAPHVPYKEADFLTEAECDRLLAANPDSPWRHYAALALWTGMRRAELLGLLWEDIDFDRGVLRVVRQWQFQKGGAVERGPKGERSRRTIPLHAEAVEMLKAIQARQRDGALAGGMEPPTWVFAHMRDGYWSHYNPNAASSGVKAMYVRAGLPVPKRPVHALRHTLATLIRMDGADRRLAQEQLGHAATGTIDRYQHVPSAEHRAVIDRVTRKLPGSGKGGAK